WQKPGQQNVAQELIKIIINYVAELRLKKPRSAICLPKIQDQEHVIKAIGEKTEDSFSPDYLFRQGYIKKKKELHISSSSLLIRNHY
ncbi:hypothetical protein JJE63_00005, partial [Alloprevotella tannerae]|uniref:hypothetical protein n=1 Tax=Alloprevotella tannerae TaxID=76122 RepID=UPI001EDC585F